MLVLKKLVEHPLVPNGVESFRKIYVSVKHRLFHYGSEHSGGGGGSSSSRSVISITGNDLVFLRLE